MLGINVMSLVIGYPNLLLLTTIIILMEEEREEEYNNKSMRYYGDFYQSIRHAR